MKEKKKPFLKTIQGSSVLIIIGLILINLIIRRPTNVDEWMETLTLAITTVLVLGLPTTPIKKLPIFGQFLIYFASLFLWSAVDGFYITKDAGDVSALITYAVFSLIFGGVSTLLGYLINKEKLD